MMTQTQPSTAPIVATAGRYYRNARFLLAAGAIAAGAWFAYDGWVAWPQANQRIAQLEQSIEKARIEGRRDEESSLQAQRKAEKGPHSDFDILIQKLLAFGLPLAGIGLLANMLYRSRGQIRLENDVLHAPGHPPIPLDRIQAVDDSQWERKGVAKVTYTTNTGTGTVVLDDFIYARQPTDAIHDRIVDRVGTQSPG